MPLDDTDRMLAGVALNKRSAGQKLSRAEAAALKRLEKEAEEKRRRDYYRTCPKKHYAEMSGRQQKVLNEQAARYGLPIDGAVISLPDVLRAFHDLLAEIAKRGIALDGDVINRETPKEALQSELLAIKVARQKGELVHAAELQEFFTRSVGILRGGLDRLQRECGDRARDLMSECLDDLERELKVQPGD